jgi:hypothetical protein
MGTRPYAEVFAIVQEIQKQAAPQVPAPQVPAPQGAEEPQLAGLND